MTSSPEIIVEPGNPYDFLLEDLEQLAGRLNDATSFPTRIALRAEEGYGVSLHEVIYVWVLLPLESAAIAKALDVALDWARERLRGDQHAHADSTPRPRSVIVLGPNGRPLMNVVIRDPDAEPEEQTDDSLWLPPRQLP